jgi:hypothetical protein
MPYKDQAKRREWFRRRKARIRAEFFQDKSCEWCGSRERLELHHKEPELKIDHRIWTWSAARREAEIAKCMVLCHDCHLAIHSAFLDEAAKKIEVMDSLPCEV